MLFNKILTKKYKKQKSLTLKAYANKENKHYDMFNKRLIKIYTSLVL